MPLTPQSCKAKGRKLQNTVVQAILQKFPWLHESDVRSTSMGASGEDILLSFQARQILPISIECKHRQTLNIWESLNQCKTNVPNNYDFEISPTLIVKKNHKPILAVIELDQLLELYYKLYKVKEKNMSNDIPSTSLNEIGSP